MFTCQGHLGWGGAGLSPPVERSPEEVGTRRKISPCQSVRRGKPEQPASSPESTRTSRKELELIRQSDRTNRQKEEVAATSNLANKKAATAVEEALANHGFNFKLGDKKWGRGIGLRLGGGWSRRAGPSPGC